MANERDDDLEPGFRDEPYDSGDRNADIVAKAKARTNLPAMLLMLTSVVMIALAGFGVWLNFFSDIDLNERTLIWMRDNFAPNQQAKDDMQKEIDKRKTMDKTTEKVMNGVGTVVSIIVAGVIMFAGIQMRELKSYGLCMTGSVLTLICLSCYCCGLIVGIWAIVVLANKDVKRGFQIVRGRA